MFIKIKILIMKILKKINKPKDFKAYESARIVQNSGSAPEKVTNSEVKAATNKINPDEASMESRG